jgi:hypothetical protein
LGSSGASLPGSRSRVRSAFGVRVFMSDPMKPGCSRGEGGAPSSMP